MKENFAYLKDVLGIKHLKKNHRKVPAKIAISVVFIGEGLGGNNGDGASDAASELLAKMIGAMGLKAKDVFIAGDLSEARSIMAKVTVALGETAMRSLLKNEQEFVQVRGKILSFENRKLMVTYHPSYLLSNTSAKKQAWEDLKLVMKELSI